MARGKHLSEYQGNQTGWTVRAELKATDKLLNTSRPQAQQRMGSVDQSERL